MTQQANISKFQQIQHKLEADIRAGVYAVGTKIPAERDLAKVLGVSHMTVNKAICGLETSGLVRRVQGDGTYVAPEKESVFKRTIGYVGPTTMSMEHAGLPAPLLEAARKNKYITSIFDIKTFEDAIDSFRLFISENPLALLIDARSFFPASVISEIPDRIKIAFIDNYELPKRVDRASYILGDYFDGGMQSANELIQQGRKNIAIIACGEGCMVKAGAESALMQAGLKPYQIIYSNQVDEVFWQEFAADKNLDGIVSSADFRVVKAIDAMNDLGVNVPDDVAVIGYYNTPWAHAYKMTSIDPQRDVIAEMAMTAIKSPVSQPLDIKIRPKIVYRQSCKKNEE